LKRGGRVEHQKLPKGGKNTPSPRQGKGRREKKHFLRLREKSLCGPVKDKVAKRGCENKRGGGGKTFLPTPQGGGKRGNLPHLQKKPNTENPRGKTPLEGISFRGGGKEKNANVTAIRSQARFKRNSSPFEWRGEKE